MVKTKEAFIKKYYHYLDPKFTVQDFLADLNSVIKNHKEENTEEILDTEEPTEEEHREFLNLWFEQANKINTVVGNFVSRR